MFPLLMINYLRNIKRKKVGKEVWIFSSADGGSVINAVVFYPYRLIELLINGIEIQKLLLLLSIFHAFILKS